MVGLKCCEAVYTADNFTGESVYHFQKIEAQRLKVAVKTMANMGRRAEFEP